MYDEGDDTGLPITKSGKISVIILSIIIVVIAVIGYIVLNLVDKSISFSTFYFKLLLTN